MSRSNKTIEFLKSDPLFDKIRAEDLPVMLNCIGYQERHYKKGEFIHLEEDDLNYIGIIMNGSADVIKEDIWGGRSILLRMSSHDLFGASFACSHDHMSSVSIQARTNTTAVLMPFHRVMHTCNATCGFHSRLIENMVSIIAEKNRLLMQKVEIISQKTLRDKLLAYLSWQAQENDSKSFTIPLGRVELADYVSSDRSALTRELNAMRDDGLIDFEKNSFTILI